MQPSNPLTFAMQTTILVFASLQLSNMIGLSSGASSMLVLPGSESEPGSCRLLRTNCSSPPDITSEELLSPEITVLWKAASSSTTASSSIKEHHPLTPLRGLGDCTTMQPSNPLTFAMQTTILVFASLQLSNMIGLSSGASSMLVLPGSESEPGSCRLLRTNCSSPPDITSEELLSPEITVLWKAASSSTTASSSIKEHHPLTPLRGLGDCTTMQPSNPLTFAMQVSKSYVLFAKKSSNYFLVQFPSPHCCITIAVECAHMIHSLLILSGDVETNPGPNGNAAILTELQKLSAGQAQLIAEVQSLKSQLSTTDKRITDLNKRMGDLETHYQTLLPLRNDIEKTQTNVINMTKKIQELETSLDDAENRSRRNNLLFYGIPDPTRNETWAESEKMIIDICNNNLGLTVQPNDIERAHRLGIHSLNRNRPIIVKFLSYKTRDALLSNGRKLKNTNYSIGEDFSRPVQYARKQLLAFAKARSDKFSLRFKTLHVGSKRYIFDASSHMVKEIA
ncbi:uncharacterized protein LOC142814728 [Rhipicephalus microplus]|uniref:uncharacterized protein LOC142776777 n=1 Tax=Rhipicephalus microplus TaxID=6941 RepID=UPI003F6BC2FA